MSVHYKFKSALDFDTITFDGLHISVGDLKKAIIQQKRLGKSSDFDLQITNAQTKEEYPDDGTLIPKNTSLIIARIPLAAQPKKPWDPQSDKNQSGSGGSGSGICSTGGANQRSGNSNESNSGTLDLSQMNGTEEDKIQAMMIQSTMDYDPNNYQKIRGQGQTGEVPPNYRCFKCHKPGHWIKNCPLSINTEHIEIKRNTGIPRSFIERDAQEKSAEQSPEPPPPAEKKQEIPEDLICSICKDLLTDAVMIPCCGSSFCDECVRTALLESEENECPDCKEKGSSPGLLIPNRFLRNSVNAFKNETGYNKPPHKQEPPKPTVLIEDSIAHQSQQKESPQKVASVSQDQRSSEEKSFREETTSSPVTEKEANQEKDEGSSEIPLSTTPPQPPPSRDKNEEYSSNTEVKKQNDVTAPSSHDENESDFEDNITVTVPPAHLQSQRAAFRERHYNGRHSRHIKPPGLENSPKGNSNSQNSPSQEMRTNSPTTDDSEQMTSGLPDQQKSHSMPHHGMPMVRPIRSTGPDMYGGPLMMNSYGHPPQPQLIMVPGRPPYDMGHYGMPPGPGYVTYMRGPFPLMRPGYHPPHLIRPRHMAPMGNFASVYQGVAAKVGSGIIDDPLEAFNRIMREKEKRKGERRRTPERRRSRSIEMNTVRGRHSPPSSSYHGRQSRVRTSEERGRGRSPLPRERRGRSRDKRSLDKDRRRHHSSSFSDRSSRSRSWSIPPRKRSKSPAFRRRSRSRSQSFSTSRSRSRSRSHSHSNSQGRFRGQPLPMRYNRSPMNTMSPRYRQKENRRPERRDDFQREEFRDRSPLPGGSGIGHYMPRRPRSRARIISPQNLQYFRQDNRPPFNHGQDEYYNHPPQQGPLPQMSQPSSMGMYNENYQQYNRYPPRDMNIQPNRPDTYGGRDRVNTEYKDRYDDAPPPGTEEPPPPGFENSPPQQTRERRNSRGNDYRKQHDDNQKEYDDARHTPELKDRQPSTEREDRRRYGRDGRSWSKSHSPVNPSRSAEKVSARRSRSKTPRNEKNQDNFATKERSSNKERHISSKEGQGHVSDKEKPEHDKRRDRGGEDRDRKHGEHSRDKDKKDTEKKVSEKESKYTTKDDKDKEKEKEKEKKRESSDDEKKDRRSREKRKKKKEKDEKKRIKKEKKEREKKEKEKEREKAKEDEKEKDSTPPEEGDNEKLKSEERVSEEKQDDNKMTVEDNSISEIKDENEQPNDSVISGVDTKSNASQDREEEIKFDHEENEAEKKDNEDKFELYGDICQEEEIRYDYVSSQNEENKTEVTDKSGPTEMKGLDSVLDIHANLDFEPDLEEMTNNEENKKDNVMLPLPEPSKWERDDENQSTKDEKLNVADNIKGIQDDDKSSKVTNEVIRRAENAIFARAINAIRPIEIKKISVERQKLYANEPVSDLSPSATSSIKTTQNSPKSELQSFQITVPVNRTNSSERSVEIKQEKPTKRPLTPVRSVKDRLGSKITEPLPQKRMRSRSNSPVRNSGRDKGKPARSRSRDFRDTKRGIDNKRPYDNRGRSRDRDRIHKEFKPTDYRSRDSNRDRLRMTDRNRRDFMNRDRRDKFRERERSRDHDRDRRKSLDKSNKGYDRDRSNERNRDRDHGRDTSFRDHHKKWDREKNDNYDSRKDRSHSKSSDRDRHHKRERNTKKWYSEDEKTKSSERMASENKGKDVKQIFVHKEEIQRSEIKDDNEDHNKQIPDKATISNENLYKKSDRISKQTKNQTLTKRSRSKSESSSSSSSSDYDSDSESEDNKKKKRKKHKKDKKRARRSSSVDSSPSTKHKRSKRSKSKKKKSSKKKKKSKK